MESGRAHHDLAHLVVRSRLLRHSGRADRGERQRAMKHARKRQGAAAAGFGSAIFFLRVSQGSLRLFRVSQADVCTADAAVGAKTRRVRTARPWIGVQCLRGFPSESLRRSADICVTANGEVRPAGRPARRMGDVRDGRSPGSWIVAHAVPSRFPSGKSPARAPHFQLRGQPRLWSGRIPTVPASPCSLFIPRNGNRRRRQ